MGMFDYVRSSYLFLEDLDEKTIFQTKTIDDYVDGSLNTYYIDPSGCIWMPDYTGTNDVVFLEEGDPEYNSKTSLFNYKWVPTGKRGRYKPLNITKYVTIYPEYKTRGVSDKVDIKIHFKKGIIQDYEITYVNY